MSQCVSCKGRGLCGRPECPIIRRLQAVTSLPILGRSLEGYTPPEVFVGRQGYPYVRTGPLIPAFESDCQPKDLLSLDVGEVISMRSSMIRSEARVKVQEARAPGRILEMVQQMAMSSAPVRTEVSFVKPPKGMLSFDGVLTPSGPSAEIRDMAITTNPAIPRKVDQMAEDVKVSAKDAIGELYSSSVDIDQISRLLSLGLLGRERKLVPTRWSITASDDMVGKRLFQALLDLPLTKDYLLYSGGALGNHFHVLVMPEALSFEIIEIWMPKSAWSPEGTICSDSEGPRGRSEYSPLAGGYYAARLAVLEELSRMGRQGAALAVREVSESYWAPLGVWVVREAARKAMASKPKKFLTIGEALVEMESGIKTPSPEWRRCSKLISQPLQSSLADFLSI